MTYCRHFYTSPIQSDFFSFINDSERPFCWLTIQYPLFAPRRMVAIWGYCLLYRMSSYQPRVCSLFNRINPQYCMACSPTACVCVALNSTALFLSSAILCSSSEIVEWKSAKNEILPLFAFFIALLHMHISHRGKTLKNWRTNEKVENWWNEVKSEKWISVKDIVRLVENDRKLLGAENGAQQTEEVLQNNGIENLPVKC